MFSSDLAVLHEHHQIHMKKGLRAPKMWLNGSTPACLAPIFGARRNTGLDPQCCGAASTFIVKHHTLSGCLLDVFADRLWE